MKKDKIKLLNILFLFIMLVVLFILLFLNKDTLLLKEIVISFYVLGFAFSTLIEEVINYVKSK